MRIWWAFAALTACGRLGFDAHDASCPAFTNGLVGWWRFDEPSGTVATDSIAGNDGVLVGGATRVAGHIGGAIAFDGSTGHIDVGGNTAYATHTAAFTFSAWMMLAGWSTSTPDIMQIQTDGTTSPFHVLLSNNPKWDGMSTGDGDGSWIPLRTNVEPTLATWHHVVLVYDGNGATNPASFVFYLDDIVQPAVPASPYGSQTNRSRIGAAEAPQNDWTGSIDDVRIYNRALAASEIEQLFALACE